MDETRGGISRRSFLTGASIAAIAVAGAGLAGCSSTIGGGGESAETSFDEELTCDIVVVGGGGSGLAACIEAADAKKQVICVECQNQTGGNLAIVEGIFAVDSRLQQEQGITINTGDVIRRELEQGQYRVSSLGYTDLVQRSGENVNWLQDHGVTFKGVDPDHGTLPLFHRFEGSSGSIGYVPAMTAAAEAAGVEFLLETHGDSLVLAEDGSVAGVYATKRDGSVLKINAKAVIIATGSYAENSEYVKELGFDPDHAGFLGLPGHDGTGHDMAVAAGAMSNRRNSAIIGDVSILGLPSYFEGGKFNPNFNVANPVAIWLNEKGERFLNEDFALTNMMISMVPTAWQEATFAFVDEALMQRYINAVTEGLASNPGGWDNGVSATDELQSAIGKGLIFKSDTLADLASQTGFDPNLLEATVRRYNENVAVGSDRDFGKDPASLVAVGDGPYYAAKMSPVICAPVGSVRTNRDFGAIDTEGNPIKGLYVIGIEGAMLWANVYTINIAGGCNANNVNSARAAVRHATANCL